MRDILRCLLLGSLLLVGLGGAGRGDEAPPGARRLQEEARDLMVKALAAVKASGKGGPEQSSALAELSKDLREVELSLARTRTDRVKAHDRHVRLLREVEAAAQASHKAGAAPQAAYLR